MDKTCAIDIPLPIVTPRLILRAPQAGDGEAIHEAKLESWNELSKWMIWMFGSREEACAEDDEQFCQKKIKQLENKEDITLLIFNRKNNQYLGGTGLHKCDWERRFFTLGYWIRSSETNKGYATEASTALLHYAFKALEAEKVLCYCAEGNDASERIMKKLGFTKEGILRKHHLLPDGSMVDEPTYGILKGESYPDLNVKWG